MPEIIDIRPADLLIDEVNPRLFDPNIGQREAQRALAKDQEGKLQVLAKDIVEYGLNPLELPIVMPSEEGDRYIVLEGNRRLGALRALEHPDSVADAVTPSVLKELRKLSKQYYEAPIDFVQCQVVKDRDEVEHWLRLKHTGENAGAGIVRWGPQETARFNARGKAVEPHLEVLDFLEDRGDLTSEERASVNTSTLKRMISNPTLRSRVGVGIDGKRLTLLAEADRVAKALLYLVKNIPPVKEVYTAPQRVAWANKIPKRIAIDPTDPKDKGSLISEAEKPKKKAQKAAKPVPRRQRKTLIPNDCVLNVTDPRCSLIEEELRRLEVERFTNAVSVLLRVFIELSVDDYLVRSKMQTGPNDVLAKKLQDAAHHLFVRKLINEQQRKAVNRACSSDAYLAASVKLMHQYVHNQAVFPAPSDLLANWRSIQPFMTALWSA